MKINNRINNKINNKITKIKQSESINHCLIFY